MGSFQLNLGATELYRVLLQPFISRVQCSVARDSSVCARARRAPLRLINIHSFKSYSCHGLPINPFPEHNVNGSISPFRALNRK